MILPRFDVLIPESVEEACAMLREHAGEGIRVLAGGTDLLVDLRRVIIVEHVPRCDGCSLHPCGTTYAASDCALWSSEPLADAGGSLRAYLTRGRREIPRYLVSLHRIKSLKGIAARPDGGLRVGALTTVSEIERSPEIRKGWTALAEGADSLGSPLVRNRGTIGGNIANARPAADTAIPTVALGGLLTLQSAGGSRVVAAADFAQGPGRTVLQPDEVLSFIDYPAPRLHSGSVYYKLANRKALEISMVGVAVHLSLEDPAGPVADACIALGAVGPTPIVSGKAREVLRGQIPDDGILKKAAQAAAQDARPIDDHRGSAWYRLQMVEVVAERLLKIARSRARGEKEP